MQPLGDCRDLWWSSLHRLPEPQARQHGYRTFQARHIRRFSSLISWTTSCMVWLLPVSSLEKKIPKEEPTIMPIRQIMTTDCADQCLGTGDCGLHAGHQEFSSGLCCDCCLLGESLNCLCRCSYSAIGCFVGLLRFSGGGMGGLHCNLRGPMCFDGRMAVFLSVIRLCRFPLGASLAAVF